MSQVIYECPGLDDEACTFISSAPGTCMFHPDINLIKRHTDNVINPEQTGLDYEEEE